MADVIIREFELERDYDTAVALWAQSGPGLKVGSSDSREELAKKLGRDPDLFLVAECEGQLVGTVIGGFDGRRGVIYPLAVAEGRRSQGIGTSLMSDPLEPSSSLGNRPSAFEYADHARSRMKERRVQPEEIAVTVLEPDEVRSGDDGELIAVKRMERRTLEVVYLEIGNTNRVITVIVSRGDS